MKTLLISISLYLCSTAIQVNAQNAELIVKTVIEGTLNRVVQDYKIGIYKFEHKTERFIKIYQLKKLNIGNIEVSPNNKYVSIIETEKQSEEEWEKTKKLYVNNLVIIDNNGNVVQEINRDVQNVSWHSDGEIIAYITGTYKEGGYGFSSDGVYYMNVTTGKEIKIQNIKYPVGMHWVKKNTMNFLYIKDSENNKNINHYCTVYEFNSATQQIRHTDYRDINFSPDGKYYVQYTGEAVEQFGIFETATNKDITDQFPLSIDRKNMGAFKWVFDQGNYFWFASGQEHYIYELESKKLVSQFTRTKTVNRPDTKDIKVAINTLLFINDSSFSILKKEKNNIIEQKLKIKNLK